MPLSPFERKKVYHRRKKKGVCPTPGCKGKPFFDTEKQIQRAYCEQCLNVQSLCMSELHEARKKKHLCVRCEARLDSEDRKKKHVHCKSCRKKANKISRKRQADLRARGLCQLCGKPGKVREDGHVLSLCDDHHKKQAARDAKRTEKKRLDEAYRASIREARWK